jgi:PRTRC genetic system ThiF family protein
MLKQNKPLVHYACQYFTKDIHPITVDVVGCGGTGSNMLKALVRIHLALRGIGKKGLHVTAWDYDIVSKTNPGRQMFYSSDIGLNKAFVLITRINRAYGTGWESMPISYTRKNTSHHNANIVISCVDKIKTRFDIGKVFWDAPFSQTPDTFHSLYWMDIGNSLNSGQIILGSKIINQPPSEKYQSVKKLRTFDEMFTLDEFPDDQDQGPSCSMREALDNQGLFINSLLSEFAGDMLAKLLIDWIIDSQGLYYNGDLMLISKIKLDGKEKRFPKRIASVRGGD